MDEERLLECGERETLQRWNRGGQQHGIAYNFSQYLLICTPKKTGNGKDKCKLRHTVEGMLNKRTRLCREAKKEHIIGIS